MDYEEQLSAAKFRAERDQARQESERWKRDVDNRRVELCSCLGIDTGTGWSDAMSELGKRLMPEGMEWLLEVWPRFEDGEPLRIGGEVTVTVHDEDGDFDRTFAIRSIKYKENGVLLEGTKNEMVILSLGERVKRPAVLAADGEPLEVGQTVWRIDTGAEYWVKRGQTITADAVVIIRKTDCDCESEITEAHQLTHQRPVLDADGAPIHEGDTVYDKDTGDRFEVDGFSCGFAVCTDVDACEPDVEILPSQLTHAKPKMDSWEQLKADIYREIEMQPTLRTTKCGIELFVSNIVRRCKSLAERG